MPPVIGDFPKLHGRGFGLKCKKGPGAVGGGALVGDDGPYFAQRGRDVLRKPRARGDFLSGNPDPSPFL